VLHHDEDERLSPQAAFEAHTRGGHAARRDDTGGVLEPGASASYVVWDLSDGAVQTPSGGSALPDLDPHLPLPTCVQTVVAGVSVYSAEDSA
jgi:hypothetical protein